MAFQFDTKSSAWGGSYDSKNATTEPEALFLIDDDYYWLIDDDYGFQLQPESSSTWSFDTKN